MVAVAATTASERQQHEEEQHPRSEDHGPRAIPGGCRGATRHPLAAVAEEPHGSQPWLET